MTTKEAEAALAEALARWMDDGDFEVWTNDHRDTNRRWTASSLAADITPYAATALRAIEAEAGPDAEQFTRAAEPLVQWYLTNVADPQTVLEWATHRLATATEKPK